VLPHVVHIVGVAQLPEADRLSYEQRNMTQPVLNHAELWECWYGRAGDDGEVLVV
jgi:hypothetical protein